MSHAKGWRGFPWPVFLSGFPHTSFIYSQGLIIIEGGTNLQRQEVDERFLGQVNLRWNVTGEIVTFTDTIESYLGTRMAAVNRKGLTE